MAYTPIEDAEIQVLKPVTAALLRKVQASLAWLFGTIGTLAVSDVQNGSFEIDSDSDGVPDGWVKSLFPGGAMTLDTASQVAGSKCVKFTHPGGAGNGGGYVESDYIPVSDQMNHYIQFWLSISADNVKAKMIFRWFDKDKVTISDSTALSRIKAGSAYHLVGDDPPANARFCKLRLVGGDSSLSTAGSVVFDQVFFNRLITRPVVPLVTIAPAMPADEAMADISTVTFPCPIANIGVRLVFSATMTVEAGGTLSMRFRVGARYSNTVVGPAEGSTTAIFYLEIPAAEMLGTEIVLVMQGGGLGTVTCGKVANDMEIQFANPFNLSRTSNGYL